MSPAPGEAGIPIRPPQELDLLSKERLEVNAWRDSPTESPQADSLENIINKLTDAPVFMEAFARHRDTFMRASTLLELGGGQGWASCIAKRILGNGKRVIATDLSPFAVASTRKWERLFSVQLDGAFACRSYELPVRDGSLDLIFTFQAAHHFVAHRSTANEIQRVLRPGGTCLYLHEPTCHRLLHTLARARVNTNGMPVPEDVLVLSRLKQLGEEAGLDVSSNFDLSLAKRGPVEMLYYLMMRKSGPLKHVLPCTRDICFRKRLP